MDRMIDDSSLRRATFVCAAVLLLAVMPLSGAIHVIQFGGAVGFNYSPKTMTVAVGDVVEWIGDFTIHPLSSSTIPVGASAFQCAVGTQFQYVVQVAGTHNYYCTNHGGADGSGMAGSFTAVVTGVDGDQYSATPATFRLEQNYPNPFNPTTTISYALPQQAHVVLTVYNTLGQRVAELVNAQKEAGSYDVTFNAGGLASGVYLCRMQAGRFVETKRLVLVK